MGNATLACGSASIQINPRETEARLVFIPEKGAVGWDLAAVIKLAADKQITPLIDQKTIDGFLQKAARARTRDPMELVVCHGVEPEDPVGEQVNWEALPVPQDMSPYQEETLANAEAPLLIRIRAEKIKHEKKVAKPGALPFLAGKEETVVSWEKKEIKERVSVNTEVREIKYADKGTKAGTVVPPTQGKPGKNVFGRIIPPKAAGEGAYLLGRGLLKTRNELVAQVSGFIRIGENWADMVALAKHSYTIFTGIDGLTLFFRFEPGDPRFTLPTGGEILDAARAKGAAEENLINADEINEAIAESITTNVPVEAFALFRAVEAVARVDINPEKTIATLYLRKGMAGALPLENRAISQAIKESGIHGFDSEKLKAAIQAFMAGKELELKDYVLVEGVPSTRGTDREVQIAAEVLSEGEQKPVLARLTEWHSRNVLKDMDIDPQKATGFALVEKDQVVAKVIGASSGEAGKDIYGNTIPGLPGNDPEIKLYRGLMQYGSEIKATRNGLLIIEAGDKSFRGRVFHYQDAKIDITVSGDAMEARGDFYREVGLGLPLTLENIEKLLAAGEIKKGINWNEVEKACVLARSEGKALDFVIARGELPLAKGESAVKWLLPLNIPELASADAADMAAETSPEKTILVKAGTALAELSEPDPDGRPGYDVYGNKVTNPGAAAVAISHDKSVTEITLKKGKRLIAVRSGELVFDGREIKILSVKEIDGDAGSATGNIKFSGEIRIGGSVRSGCAIIGGSHVIVNGLVESALISAGGKAVVALGFKGGGRGVIRARAGIEAAFAERGSIMTVGDIYLKKGSINSTIKTNGKLFITADNGKISGGVCQARHGIDTVYMGSEKGPRTEVSFGQDYVVKEQIGVYEEEIAKLKRKLSETEEEIQNAVQNKVSLPDKVREEKIRLVKLLEQLNLKVFTLREKFEEHNESEVRIRGTVFPGVVIESHNRYYEIKQKRDRVIFYFDRKSGTIKEKPLDD